MTFRVRNQTETYLKHTCQHTNLLTYVTVVKVVGVGRMVTVMTVKLNLQPNLNTEIVNNNKFFLTILLQIILVTLF